MKVSKGFTLIELLVVIAIIGILSSVVLASLNTARERAANARRLSDIRQIQSAMELYALSNNGNYPNFSATTCDGAGLVTLQNMLAPYIASIPHDPAENCTTDRKYFIINSATDYKIISHNLPNGASVSRSLWDPVRDGGSNPAIVDGSGPWAVGVWTPGLAGW